MATRMVTDCDKCGKENINDSSYRLDVPVVSAGEDEPTTKRIDLDTRCLGQALQDLLEKMTPEQGSKWLENMSKTKVKATKKAA